MSASNGLGTVVKFAEEGCRNKLAKNVGWMDPFFSGSFSSIGLKVSLNGSNNYKLE